MLDLLLVIGTDLVAAARYVNAIRKLPSVTFMERHGQGG